MKKIIFIMSWLLISSSGFSQICTDFNSGTTDGWQADTGLALNIQNPNTLDGSDFLSFGPTDLETWVFNDNSYPNNWKELGCLCFDYKTFLDVPGNPNITIYQGSSPSTATLSATFTAYTAVTPGDDWINVCAPINLCTSSGLPSNSVGQWVMNSGSGCGDWNTLLSNVSGVAFWIDRYPVTVGPEAIGVDNICVSIDCEVSNPEPTPDGAFCCDLELDDNGVPINPNLVVNGNFEFGNTGFMSAYSPTLTTYPGEYDVTSSAAAFGATVTDHSFCDDPSMYAGNTKFMVVNGKTQQTGSSIIWEQNVTGLIEGEEYKMCANFKDMEQCTFNIYPKIKMYAGSNVIAQTINTNDADPCDWERLEICFVATGSSINLKIELDETGNGDGNDLAIDDIALQQKLEPGYFMTLQHQGNNNTITASLNTISPTDDVLLNQDCELQHKYRWFVYETTTPTGVLGSGMVPGTFGWASDLTGGGPANSIPTPWALTTNFPNYTTFGQNRFYVIGMYIESCCESCFTEQWMFQVTFNFRTSQIQMQSDEKGKELIKRLFEEQGQHDVGSKGQNKTIQANVFPNPANKIINISLENENISSVQIVSITGQVVKTIKEANKQTTVNIANLTKGVYIVNITDENNKKYSSKFIKK